MPATFSAQNPVMVLAHEVLDGDVFALHHHDHAQLILGMCGSIKVNLSSGSWVVPPHRAVWIPPYVDHEVCSIGRVSMRPVCIHKSLAEGLPTDCTVIEVSGVLRSAVERLSETTPVYAKGSPEERLSKVVIDELNVSPSRMMYLPTPKNRAIRYITENLISNPADPRTLDEWAAEAGASKRSLSRHFKSETGMTFREWRRQLHLHEAIARLSANERVAHIAYDLGYSNPSAFIDMFKNAMGTTPGQYLRN